MRPRSGKLIKDIITIMRQVYWVQGLANLRRTISKCYNEIRLLRPRSGKLTKDTIKVLQWDKIIESKVWQTYRGHYHYNVTSLLSPRSGKHTKDNITTMRQDYWVQGLANLQRALSLQWNNIIESKVWQTYRGQYYNETSLLSPRSGKLTEDNITTMRQVYWVQGLANLRRTLSLQWDQNIESKVWQTYRG